VSRVKLHSFYIQLLLINFVTSLNWKVWSKIKLSVPIGRTVSSRAKMGSEHGLQEPRVVLHSFYIQLLLIKLVSSINWNVWPKVLLELNWAQTGRKCGFQEAGVVLHTSYIQLLVINLVSSMNKKFDPKVKLLALIDLK